MANPNVERAQSVYAAWNAHDWDRVVNEIADDHTLHLTGLLPGFRPVYDGKAGMREFLDRFDVLWKDFRVEVDRIEDVGDKVVGLIRLHGTATGSGVPVSIEYAHVFHLSDAGPAVRTDAYRTWQEALDAAGVEG